MIALEEAENLRIIATPDLRLIFRRSGGRWSHTLEVRDGQDWQGFAESVETDADRDAPSRIVSPTYQELQWRREENSAFALLTGSFGPHHFSTVFRMFEPRIKGGRSVFHVDINDRCQSEVKSLASTYRILSPPSTLGDATPVGTYWPLPGGNGSILLGCSDDDELPARISLAEASRSQMLAQVEAIPRETENTRRFLYWWSLATGSES